MAPEQIQQKAYDLKADIWQAGCCIYHLACLDTPFSGETLNELTNSIINRKPKPFPHVYSVRLRNFIESFLHKQPQLRPTAKEALKMFPKFVLEDYQTYFRPTLDPSSKFKDEEFKGKNFHVNHELINV